MSKINVSINADSATDLKETVLELSAVFGAQTLAEVEEPVKESKPVKEEKKQTKKSSKKEEEPEQEEAEDTKVVKVEDLRAKATELSKAGKKDEVKELLAEFEVKAVSAIPKERSAEFMERLEEL